MGVPYPDAAGPPERKRLRRVGGRHLVCQAAVRLRRDVNYPVADRNSQSDARSWNHIGVRRQERGTGWCSATHRAGRVPGPRRQRTRAQRRDRNSASSRIAGDDVTHMVLVTPHMGTSS